MPMTKPMLSFLPPKAINSPSNVRGPIDPSDPRQQEITSSIAQHGILQPLLVMSGNALLAGHRRLAAALALGLETVPVIVTDRMLSDTEIRLIQLAENIHRVDLSGFEKFRAASELLDLNPGWQLKDLAEQLHLSPASITHLLSPSRCTPAWQAALQAGKVPLSACYDASKLPLADQDGLLALRLSGASKAETEKATRKKRVPDAVKLSRVRCPVSKNGTTVVVTGPEMDLQAFADVLVTALDQARRALKEQIDIRTAEAVWRDRSKAGA